MTTILPVQCLSCSRLDRSTTAAGSTTAVPFRCTAYPDQIPRDLAMLGADHRIARGDEAAGLTFNLAVGSQATFDIWRRTFGGSDVSSTQRSYSQENGATYTAPASSAPQGGQFAAGGGRVGAKGKKKITPRRPARNKPKPSGPPQPFSFDGKHGTGYGVQGGDPGVRIAQAAINRLGLTDSSGKPLAVDGKYGPRTTSAVKKLQKALGLPVDGKMTPALLKQATELKQLPPKTVTPRKPRAGKPLGASTRRSRILGSIARALGECYLVDGVCMACEPDGLDEMSRALVEAFDEIERVRHVRTLAGAKKYGLPIGSVIGGSSSPGPHVPNAPHHVPDLGGHPSPAKAIPEAPPVAPKAVAKAAPKARTSAKDRLVAAIDTHLKGDGSGDPFDGFDREQLRKVARERGVALDRGEHRDAIAKKLLDHARGGSHPESKPAPAVKKAAAPNVAPKRERHEFDEAKFNSAATGASARKAMKFNYTVDGFDLPSDTFQKQGLRPGQVDDAITDYGSNAYEVVNPLLRQHKGKPDNYPAKLDGRNSLYYTPQRAKATIEGLDAAFAYSKTTKPVVVTRGMHDLKLFGSRADGNLAGLEYVDPAYLSTSVRSKAGNDFTGNGSGVSMRIFVPPGIPAVSSAGLDKDEILLGRGLRFRVVRDQTIGNARHLDLEVIP